jgi:hypothetical protein
LGRDLLVTKLLHLVSSVPYEEGMLDKFPAGSLVHFNWRTADGLANTTVRATRDGSLKRVDVLVILDDEVLASRETLLKINITLRTLWACTIILVNSVTQGPTQPQTPNEDITMSQDVDM